MSEVRVEQRVGDEPEDQAAPRQLGISALAHDAAIYGGTRVFLKSLAFLLVPLYAHFLTRAEFGALEIVLAMVAFVDAFINLSGVLARFYFDRDDRGFRRQAITAFLLIEAVYPAVLVAALIAFAGPLTGALAGPAVAGTLLVIALLDLYLTNIVDVPMALCRLRRKPWTFAAYAVTRGVTQIVLSVLLVAVWRLEVKGILLASLAAACLVFAVTVREYARDLTRRIDWTLVREMVSFGWPTIVSALSFYGLNLLDRFFIKHYHGLADNGLYGVAFRYSQIVLVGVFAFRMGWPQWHYSWLRSGRHPQMVARGANYYFFAIGFLAVAVAAWILPLFHLILPERFWDAATAVAPLSLAAVATGGFTVSAVGFNVTKRMRWIPVLSTLAALLAVGLYFLLIPPYSFVGAAWATAASLAVDAAIPLVPSLPLRAGITIAYPVLLAALGFFPPEDLRRLRALVRR